MHTEILASLTCEEMQQFHHLSFLMMLLLLLPILLWSEAIQFMNPLLILAVFECVTQEWLADCVARSGSGSGSGIGGAFMFAGDVCKESFFSVISHPLHCTLSSTASHNMRQFCTVQKKIKLKLEMMSQKGIS